MPFKYPKCQICNKRRKSTTHHITPKRFFNGRGYKFELCRECHNELESLIPPKTKLTRREYYFQLIAFVELKLKINYIDPELPEKLKRRLL